MKFLYGYFNQDTGQSTVTLADKYGIYTGQAKLHPDDKNIASKYMGCGIAQRRAWIKSLQNKLRREKIKLNTIKILIKDFELNDQNLMKSKSLKRRLNLQIKRYTNEIKNTKEEIELLKEDIRKRIEIRDKIIKNK